ncbi:MAG: hypothetical protein ACXIUZ_06130 [Lysobacteraceae bacterium]
MSIQRSPSSTTAADAGRSSTRSDGAQGRDPAPTRAVEAFREAMFQARNGSHEPALRHHEDGGQRTEAADLDRRRLQGELPAPPGLEAAAQALHAAGSPEAATASRGPDPQAVAAMIERHVRQLFVSEGGLDARGNGDVLLRLDEGLLPGTDLVIRREGTRWRLEAQTANRDVLASVERFAPELTERFAARGLGELEVVSRLRPGT